jgi:glycosyltransferase involved in cell wall biosynthesis
MLREGLALGQRQIQRATRRGLYARPLEIGRDKLVLLFFADVDRDTFIRNDRYLRQGLRRLYHALKRRGQRVSGFGVAFARLKKALEAEGYQVVLNDYALARRSPQYPIGIAGYPHVLDNWKLQNPAVLGPGLFDHPSLAPDLMKDPRFRSYIVPSQWMRDIFEPAYGSRCAIWFAGTDMEDWPDMSSAAKDLDIVVYEKFLWDRAENRSRLLEPILAELRRANLRIEVLRYGTYQYEDYRALLRRSRGMLFLCEHETQGIAYQEALASNVPILAWVQGYWLDPNSARYDPSLQKASSVPYFSAECGETFQSLEDFSAALSRFRARLSSYEPRRYVQGQLTLAHSARRYLELYRNAALQ